MQTKYILHIGDKSYALSDESIRNWRDVMCTYKRADLDGVIRSFTSSFEFVNDAYAILLDLYLEHDVNAYAEIEMLAINDNWEYSTLLRAPLDFTTINIEGGVLTLNCIVTDLESKIKANRSTKYELRVVTDIKTFKTLSYDRMRMSENAKYEFTQGQSIPDSKDLIVPFSSDKLPWVGLVSSEVCVNGVLFFADDQQNEEGSYMLEAVKNCDVELVCKVYYLSNKSTGNTTLTVKVTNPYTNKEEMHHIGMCAASNKVRVQATSPDQLPPYNRLGNRYAIIGNDVYIEGYNGWENTHKSEREYFAYGHDKTFSLHLEAQDRVTLISEGKAEIYITDSLFQANWQARGKVKSYPLITPSELCRRLLTKMNDGKFVAVSISDYDARLADTYIVGGETLRQIAGAKIYSSFTEFCEWMATVFGYTYYIDKPQKQKIKHIRSFNRSVANYYPLEDFYNDYVYPEEVYFDSRSKTFFVSNGSGYFQKWEGWDDYMTAELKPREDTVFTDDDGNSYIYDGTRFVAYDISDFIPADTEECVYFIHRSELFAGEKDKEGNVRYIENTSEVSYSLNTSNIYSSVEVGYERKEYEMTNGRDEFNFSIVYSTKTPNANKPLKLISKYRADSFGIEYAVQKSDVTTTDNVTDNDVFFILCAPTDYDPFTVVVNRDIKTEGVSPDIFNAAFSPVQCVLANVGYIAMQSNKLTLYFASCTGNSDIVIDGRALSSDIVLDGDLLTCGVVEFSTDDLTTPNGTELIMIHDNGLIYTGYLADVDFNYAIEESAKYKLLVKDIRYEL